MEERILELIEKYKDYPEETVKELISSASRVEYATAGTGYLEGYYCPSRTELFVIGCKRGRLIKKPGKDFDGYKYYFSDDNDICLIDTYSSRELMIREGDCVYGIFYEYYHLFFITEAQYNGDLIHSYSEYSIIPYDLKKEMSIKDNIRIGTNFQKYLYSDEAVPSIRAVIWETRQYNSCERIDKIISSSAIDLVRKNDETTSMRIDNQKKLIKKLEQKIKKVSSLEQAVKEFFAVVAEAFPNDEEMLLYEVGCYHTGDDSEVCMFCLVRQTPSENGEYYQMHLELQYETDDKTMSLNECTWHEKGDDDLYEYVVKSEAYRTLKERTYNKISVWVDET